MSFLERVIRSRTGKCHPGPVSFMATLSAVILGLIWLSPAGAQTAVTIGTAKDPNLAAQIVIAREKGYFKDAGLNATVKYFPSGGDLMAAVVGGSVVIGSSGSTPTITLRARSYPIEILSQISDISGAQEIIVKKNLKSLDDLYGKKIAIMRGTSSQALFNAFAQAYGFDDSKVELVNMDPVEMVTSFTRGAVDAVSLWEPFATHARKLGGGKLLVSGTRSMISGNEGERRIYGDHSVLFAKEVFIHDHPDTIKAVLTALVRANDFIKGSGKEANGILAKEFGLDAADMADVMAVNHYTLAIDGGMVADLNRVTHFLYELKRIRSQPKAIEWIDAEPLRAVQPRLVNIK